jgi:hypothetical protein
VRPITLTAGPLAAPSANNIALSQTPTSGTALTLNGSLVSGGVATLDAPRRVLLTYGNEGGARTLVLVGTDRYGARQGETLAVPSGAGGTVASVLDYKTLISATPAGGGWTAAVTVGTNGVASSAWARLDDMGFGPVDLGVDVTGVVNYTVESSVDDPNLMLPQVAVPVQSMTWQPHPNLASQTIKANDVYTAPPAWVRLTLNSQTNPGAATLVVRQAGGKGG